jgi:hypothetical protein
MGVIAAGFLGAVLVGAGPVGAQTDPTTPTAPSTPTVPSTSPAPVPQQAPQSQSSVIIQPIVECSFLDTGTGFYNTVWGYKNFGFKDETVPVGSSNSFDNPSTNAGQPTLFKKGRAQNVFIVTHKGSSTWRLAGRSATAPGTACKTNPVPLVGDGAGGLITIIVITLVLGLIMFVRFRPRRS